MAASALRRNPWQIVVLLAGIPLGLGGFTFLYAEGGSYLSSDPRACVNCHIMRSEYDGWQKAGHHQVATCVECHLPHDLLPKYAAKGLNGFNHSKAFTLQNFPEPIQISARNAAALQENCLRCHGALVHELVAGAAHDRDAIRCVHCHARVGHGELAAVGGPDRGEVAELEAARRYAP